ncbi:hypothetical protein ACR80S_05735 [Halomonas sp. MA07-2]|uniref:hypothetical protein n=1 Tax=unclassified Halomonas TaxID=2609666 RepID=UPI003EEE5F98
MNEMGGYIEFDLPVNRGHLHPDALRLNTAGNTFRLILSRGDIHHVYVPNYICDSMVTPLHDMQVKHTFYSVNDQLDPEFFPDINDDERLLYVNYFGIKDDTVARLAKRYGHRLIVDNSQALFSSPLPDIDTLYSPRKFVGVPDGAYWYSRQGERESLHEGLPFATSWQALSHLAGRLEEGASLHYSSYVAYEKRLDTAPIERMSRVSEMILCGFDYESYRERRRENFSYLDERLAAINGMSFDLTPCQVPMVYPLVISRTLRNKESVSNEVRECLLSKKIYLPRYWSDVTVRPTASLQEKALVDDLLPLPIDQRYRQEDMKFMADCVEEILA